MINNLNVVEKEQKPKVKVRLKYVTKEYNMVSKRTDWIKSLFIKISFDKFWAVRGVDFEAYEGETIAVIGTNGSGKSTLMKMLAGISQPTTGTIEVIGETSLLAINAGLRGSMTGRENIRMKALMMGLSNEQIDDRIDDIIEFSELGKFINQQVKTYSSGMKSKLGFAISAYTDPDVLIIDEALSVGDSTFTNKSLQKIKEFQKQGKTIFFVSHSLSQVKSFADRVLWMHYGYQKALGPVQKVLPRYKKYVNDYKKKTPKEQKKHQNWFKKQQTDFSLDKLYEIEKQRELNKTSFTTFSRMDDKNLYNNTHKISESKHSSIFNKILILLFVFITIVTGLKTILNMSFMNVIDHPSHLITNFAPDKIMQLNDLHGRTSSQNEKQVKSITMNSYQVRDGDSIRTIAKKFHVNESAIKKENGLHSNYLEPGSVIRIPEGVNN